MENFISTISMNESDLNKLSKNRTDKTHIITKS